MAAVSSKMEMLTHTWPLKESSSHLNSTVLIAVDGRRRCATFLRLTILLLSLIAALFIDSLQVMTRTVVLMQVGSHRRLEIDRQLSRSSLHTKLRRRCRHAVRITQVCVLRLGNAL